MPEHRQTGAWRKALLRRSPKASLVVLFFLTFVATPARVVAQEQDETRGAPAEPANAADIRAQMGMAETLLGKTPDRGAILYFLAVSHATLRETLPALEQLKQCVALKEGFDPSGDTAFAVIKTSPDFKKLVEQVHKDFPPVNLSKIAFTSTDKDIFPEGLAYDPSDDTFYMSSLHHPGILKITRDGKFDNFVPASRDSLLPVVGIRMDPSDGSVWCNSSREETGKSELLHFNREGELLDRTPPGETGKHLFNDLVVLRDGRIFLTDSLANKVYRFDPQGGAFTPLRFSRQLFYPNGIALTEDESALYVADQFGVLRMDIKAETSADVGPGQRNTLAGIDGLYWHKGSLIAVQNGIGTPRVAVFRLTPDGLQVAKTTILANLQTIPTTGALRGDDFYFIVNSQIDNLNGEHIMDVTKLQPVRIGVVHLP